MGRGPGRPPGTHRPRRPLLPPRRHLPHRRTVRRRTRPGHLPETAHRDTRPGRPRGPPRRGRGLPAGRPRPAPAAGRPRPRTAVHPGLLPLRGRQRRQLPAARRAAGGTRDRRPRRGTARARRHRHPEQPQDVEEIARRVRDELLQRATGPLMLWGHCAGSSHALATARLLEASGVGPTEVFLGALLLDPVADLRAEIDEVSALTPRQITERLMVDSSYVELDRLKPERATLVGSAYQHDVRSTNTHLMKLHADPAPHRVGVPVHVVLAADDSTTKGGAERYRDWSAIADDVVLHELPDGGHYFISTRAADIAALVAGVRRPAH
ncbi:hypothetical protein F3K43_07950 [Streptomyces sp. LBUM 1476]|nr:hypothetical protein [Streptomyces sp. LBUM 1476]